MPKTLATSIIASTVLAFVATSAGHGQDAPTPPLLKQINDGNWLPQQDAEALRDELYYQRAIHAYMTMQPALNVRANVSNET